MTEPRTNKEVPPTRFVNTRVEIYVGVTALAVLAAIITPFIQRAQQTESLHSCGSNLREVSQGLRTYAADYDGHLPPAYTWQTSLTSPKPRSTQGCPLSSEMGGGFAMDERLSGKTLATVSSSAVLLYDSSKVEQDAHDSGTSFHAPHPNPKKAGSALCGTIGFLDGHAAAYTRGDGMAVTMRGSQ